MHCNNNPYTTTKAYPNTMPQVDNHTQMNQQYMCGMPQQAPYNQQSQPYMYNQQPIMPEYQQVPAQQAPSTSPLPPGTAPINFDQLVETPVYDVEYTQGYLSTKIGQKVKVEFLIGTSMFIDREGTLVDVGISYIILQETETDDLLLCDIYSIKFVTFFY